jgi:histidinol-phosphate aminotransferase
MPLSRRAFAQLVGAGAAAAALPLPTLLGANTAARARQASKGVIRLSSNENPYGPSAAAQQAMREAFALAWRYPDEAADELIGDLAKVHGYDSDHFAAGDGSSELLKLAASAFTGPQKKLVMADPTFEALGTYARVRGADVVKVPLTAAFAHDLGAMKAAGGGLTYVCNPNNPTGSITPKGVLHAFIDSAPGMLIVDEAYHHYALSGDYESVVPLVASHANLIVLRTFSKIYGMAGLRLGYAVAQPAVIEAMVAQGAWDSVNIMALAAARASIHDVQHVVSGRARNHDTRSKLVADLGGMGFNVVPSEANFVMIDTRREVKPLIGALRERNVHVGRLFPAMPRHLRVTIGTPEEMRAFVAAFRQVVA